MAVCMPRWAPNLNGPRAGKGRRIPNCSAYLHVNLALATWPPHGPGGMAPEVQKALSWAWVQRHSKASDSASPGLRSFPRMF